MRLKSKYKKRSVFKKVASRPCKDPVGRLFIEVTDDDNITHRISYGTVCKITFDPPL